MNLKKFSNLNAERSEYGFDMRVKTHSEYFVAGLAAHVRKIQFAVDCGWKDNEMKAVFADALIYLDLCAQSAGFDLSTVTVEKFNKTSRDKGIPFIYDEESD